MPVRRLGLFTRLASHVSSRPRAGSPRRRFGRLPLCAEALEDRRLLAVFTVTSVADSGPDTLRDAIGQANATIGRDTVVFDPSLAGSTIQINSPALEISDGVDIQGLGADQLAVDGNAATRIFVIDDSRTNTLIDVVIEDLTLQNGQSTFKGGAVFSLENLTIADSIVTGSSAREGGGIAQADGTLVLRNSSVIDNRATLFGGGIASYLYPGAELLISNSTISGNLANADSGGLDLYSNGGTARVEHSTIAFNQSDGDMSGTGSGGGIGVFFGALQLDHTIVAMNQDNAGSRRDIFGLVNPRYSLIGDNDGSGLAPAPVGSPDANGNLVGTSGAPIDPLLGALGPNGGTTPSHGLLIGSPARDAGDPAFVGAPFFDQRGIPYDRVFDGRIDMGAQENQPISPLDGDFNNDGNYDCLDIDALTAAVASGEFDLLFDIYPDGVLNLSDRDAWLAEAGHVNLGFGKTYLLGDATLDGIVDGLDFVEWNDRKFTAVAAWCQGDFTMDGTVDGLDFIDWNNHKFMSADAQGVAAPMDSDRDNDGSDAALFLRTPFESLSKPVETPRRHATLPASSFPRALAQAASVTSRRSEAECDAHRDPQQHPLDKFFASISDR